MVEKMKVVVLVKWTYKHCGTRQFFTEPNAVFQFGECYVCGETTKIKAYRPTEKELIAS